MELAKAVAYMLSKPGAWEDRPFGPETAVYKIGNKMFALVNAHEPERKSLNLKYHPEAVEALRSAHEEIVPGYHMNKRHWNTVYLDGELPEALILELIDISYERVFDSLKKADRDAILTP